MHAKNIGAHHSSLAKDRRFTIERRLKEGEMKCVVSSTSLELGIDIGYVDLVILYGSPKGVNRALQRIGRSGHKLHDTVKGRIVVINRDDLVECAVMLKSAIEHRLDRIHIPKNCLDVLSQQIFGFLLDGPRHVDDLWEWTTRSYNYSTLKRADFDKLLEYLAGEYTSLEDRHVYAKIYYDRDTGKIGKRGKMARVIYSTNVGTIPDESYISVKQGDQSIGHIEEGFLEKLRKQDVFVLGGDSFRFRYSRGMTIQVEGAGSIEPSVPSWYSEMLPLSFELSLDIQDFRKQLSELFEAGTSEEEIKGFIHSELYLDDRGVESLYRYFYEQQRYSVIPHRNRILIEYHQEGPKTWVIFHTLFGRRINDVLSRAIAWLIARREDRDVELSLNDHGFYVAYEGNVKVMDAFNLLQTRDLRETMEDALKDSEILKRRFRHCATRSLMILRAYRGRRKSVGTQQMRSFILQHVIEQMDQHFPILREAYREVMEDAMDIENAGRIINEIKSGEIQIEGQVVKAPSPFSFHIIMQGRLDLIKIEDRQSFLQRMHEQLTTS
jgi:ATP-dependent Lhr-like helicase